MFLKVQYVLKVYAIIIGVLQTKAFHWNFYKRNTSTQITTENNCDVTGWTDVGAVLFLST